MPRLVYVCWERGHVEADMAAYWNQWFALQDNLPQQGWKGDAKIDCAETPAEELVEKLRRLECVSMLYAHSSEKLRIVPDALIS